MNFRLLFGILNDQIRDNLDRIIELALFQSLAVLFPLIIDILYRL